VPIQRYEHAAPGDLLHIDTKKLGRIERMSHRVTGNRRDRVKGAGWECLFVAIDDHARLAFSQMQPDERAPSAVAFLEAAVAYYASLGVTVRRLLTDNGSAFRSRAFRAACQRLGIRQKFTRAYRPQTNGKAERFIQSALREWAYGFPYHHCEERTAMLDRWLHYDNDHRPHAGIGGLPPIARIKHASANNVLKLDRLMNSNTLSSSMAASRSSPKAETRREAVLSPMVGICVSASRSSSDFGLLWPTRCTRVHRRSPHTLQLLRNSFSFDPASKVDSGAPSSSVRKPPHLGQAA